MIGSGSNIDDVVGWLEQFIRGFNFLRPGKDQNLGRDLARVVAGQIFERATQESRGANPQRWAALTPKYLTRKRRAHGWPEEDGKPNFKTGQMLSYESLLGQPQITEAEVLMVYGTGDPPRDCKSPVDNRTQHERDKDERVTDRDKGGWAHAKGRPFYELDETIEEAVIEEAHIALDEYILTEG
jgi:hypothetical protein